METTRYVAFTPAMAWLVDRPDVGVAARHAADRPNEVFADAVLADPTRLLELHRAGVIASLAPGTPAGVTEELTDVYRHVAARAAQPSATRDALLPVVASLTGLRDRHELVPALLLAADRITDPPIRERVVELARYVSPEITLKRRGRFGQVVVEQVIPTDPDPVTPDGPVRPKKPPDTGTGEPVVPLIVEGSPELDLLDQVAAVGGEAAIDWAEDAGFSSDDAAQYGALYATQLALELVYDSDIGEGSVGAGRCLLAEVLARVGEHLGGLHGHASGWQFGSAACDSPTPHGMHSAILDFASALQHQPINEMHKASMVACVICDDCVPCVIADQILRR